MSKKKNETPIEVIDTATGVILQSGKKNLAAIDEVNGKFQVSVNQKIVATSRQFPDALEAAIQYVNLHQ